MMTHAQDWEQMGQCLCKHSSINILGTMSYIIQFMHKCAAVARFWSPLAALSGLQHVCIQFHHDIWWLLTFPVRPPIVD